MRPSILIALIICGTLLVMTPAFSDYVQARQAAAVFTQRTDLRDLKFSAGEIQPPARFGFWLTGTLAIVAGIVGGFIASRAESRPRPTLTAF